MWPLRHSAFTWAVGLAALFACVGLGGFSPFSWAAGAPSGQGIKALTPEDYQRLIAQATQEPQQLQLETRLNQTALAGLLPFRVQGQAVYAQAQALQALNFKPELGITPETDLAQTPGVQVELNTGLQRMALTVDPRLLNLPTYRASAHGEMSGSGATAPALSGLLLNYDGTSYFSPTATTMHTLQSELRWFGGAGVLRQYGITQQGGTPLGSTDPALATRHLYTRQSTTFERDFDQATLRLGDITPLAPASWVAAPPLMGLQLVSRSSIYRAQLKPPSQVLSGMAEVPSRVEFWMNGVRQYSTNVPAGPFELRSVYTGGQAGIGQMQIIGANGQPTRVVDVVVYPTVALLEPGMSEWALQLGKPRAGWDIATAASYQGPNTWLAAARTGLSQRFTLEAAAEVEQGRSAALGVGLNAALSPHVRSQASVQKTLHFDASALKDHQLQASLMGDWRHFSASLQASHRPSLGTLAAPSADTSATAQAATTNAPTAVTQQVAAFAHWLLDGAGSLSAMHARQRSGDGPWQSGASLLGYSFRHQGLSAFIGASRQPGAPGARAQFTLEYRFDPIPVSTSVRRDSTDTLFTTNYAQPWAPDQAMRWRLQSTTSATRPDQQLAEAQFHHALGHSSALLTNTGSATSALLSTRGALVLGRPADSWQLFATPRIEDAFAIVQTRLEAGTEVFVERRTAARVHDDGYAIVTGLRAGEPNLVGLNPQHVSPQYLVTQWDKTIYPMRLGGALVSFESRKIRAAMLRIVDPAGQDMPVGTPVHVNGGATPTAWVGAEGRVHLDELEDHNHLRLAGQPGCELHFDYPADTTHIIPQLGEHTCR